MGLLIAFIFGMALTAVVSFAYSVWQHKKIEQRLYGIIHGSPIPTFVIKKDHVIVYWNDALEKLSGLKARDVIGTDQHWRAFYSSRRPCMADLVADDTLETVPNWYSGKYSKSKLLEKTYVATDFFPDLGESGKWLRFTAAAIKDPSGTLYGAIETLEDITEQKLAEEELLKIKTLESVGRFASGVAQDFDNLVSAVLRNIFLAKLSAEDEDKIMEDGLATAEMAGLQAKELAHQLITFAKGTRPIMKVEALDGLLDEVAASVNHPNIKFDLRVAEGLRHVEIDSPQIRKVLEQLIQNAIEAMPEGGSIEMSSHNCAVTEREAVKVPAGSYVRISVRDDGKGIAPENLPRIFDPYFTTKTEGGRKGLGLGLSLCYSILKHHGAYITVDSEPGKGTTFQIFLPVRSDSAP